MRPNPMTRRAWLRTAGGILAAPAIVRAESIMRVRPIVAETDVERAIRVLSQYPLKWPQIELWNEPADLGPMPLLVWPSRATILMATRAARLGLRDAKRIARESPPSLRPAGEPIDAPTRRR